MFYPGLVSISFREHSPEEIIAEAVKCRLHAIEWGSDIHAPRQDDSSLNEIATVQTEAAISCCSYGSYFRLGFTPMEELSEYIRAAKRLGTRIIRVWAGRKKASDCSEEERQAFQALCTQAAEIAREQDMILCLECHRRSYTETKEGALELMECVNSPNFRMYWQPNPDISVEENISYLRTLREYITHVHAFHWVADQRLPLREGLAVWEKYLSELTGDHHLLLEFMPDDRIESLAEESKAMQNMFQT
jgi:sugar phosphate isomerase/epimerase